MTLIYLLVGPGENANTAVGFEKQTQFLQIYTSEQNSYCLVLSYVGMFPTLMSAPFPRGGVGWGECEVADVKNS